MVRFLPAQQLLAAARHGRQNTHTHTHTRRAEGFDKNDHRMGAGVVVHHTSMKRNKRCLLAYM